MNTPEQRHRSHNPAVVLAAALVLIVVGASTFNILPLLVQGAVHTLNFSDQQIGVMSFAISIGSGVSALFAGLWVRSVPWPRAAVCALGGILAANSLALLVHQYWAFVFLQGIAGFCSGSVLCLGMTILSDRAESTRSFGIANAMQVVYQVAALLAGPTLLRWAGLNGILAMLAALSGVALLAASFLPARGRTVTSARASTGLLKPATLITFIGVGAYFVNAGAYWTYIGLIGQAGGLTSRVVANGIAMGVSAGVLGGILAWAVGDRWGRLWPLGISAFLTVAAALLLKGSFSVGTFVLSGLLYFFAWNYSVAYQLALINAVDATGRGVAVSGVLGYLGVAGGAALAALFVTPGSYHAVIWIMVVTVCLSTALFVLSSVVHRYAAASTEPDRSLRSTSSLTDLKGAADAAE